MTLTELQDAIKELPENNVYTKIFQGLLDNLGDQVTEPQVRSICTDIINRRQVDATTTQD